LDVARKTAARFDPRAELEGTPTRGAVADDRSSDAELVALATHDRQAFAPLYRRYVDSVYRYCYRQLGSREQAEDATSVIFERALRELPRYRNGSFRSWLFAIAHNVVVNAHRERRPSLDLGHAGDLVDAAASPEDIALAGETTRTVLDLVRALPPEQRHLIELRLAGLTGPEIAAVLGKKHGAIKVAQLRAIRRLGEIARQMGDGPRDGGEQ